MPLPQLVRSTDDRVVAGVCGGIAAALGVDATLVRLVFALLALAGGAGVLLYLALWAWTASGREWIAIALLVLAGISVLHGIGLSLTAVVAIAMIAGGLTLIWRQGGSLRPGAPFSVVGVALTVAGGVVLLTGGGWSTGFAAPGTVGAALLLVVAPWLWRLAVERDAERTARIRSEERATVAAHLHDSVLQTLALIQRHADDQQAVNRLARSQERELRAWLYDPKVVREGGTWAGLVAGMVAEVEADHALIVDPVVVGDAPIDEELAALGAATREALVNAAKHSGATAADLYTEVTPERVSVFVRDRGAGFDLAAVPDDRRGLRDSVQGRLVRLGGTAEVRSAPGEGTEVELVLPRTAA